MAKALRERVEKQYTGTQRTRKAVHGECTVELAKWTFLVIALCREPYEAKVSRPGVCPEKAGVFSRRETNLLKPLDSLIFGMGASLQAVAQANAEVAPKVSSPGGRACNREGEGSMGRRRLADAADHS